MKKQLNLTLGENTIRGIKSEAERLEMSASAFITMLYQSYEREQNSIKIMQDKDMFENMKKILEMCENEAKKI